MGDPRHQRVAPVRRVPEGFHRRVTLRVHIASHQERLARQWRHAAAALVGALGFMAALAAFAAYRAIATDVDHYAPPGLLGHLDYHLASLRMAWSAIQGNHMLLISGLLVASAGFIALLWWLGRRGMPSIQTGDRLLRR